MRASKTMLGPAADPHACKGFSSSRSLQARGTQCTRRRRPGFAVDCHYGLASIKKTAVLPSPIPSPMSLCISFLISLSLHSCLLLVARLNLPSSDLSTSPFPLLPFDHSLLVSLIP